MSKEASEINIKTCRNCKREIDFSKIEADFKLVPQFETRRFKCTCGSIIEELIPLPITTKKG